MPMIDIYKPPVGYGEAQKEVDATPSPAEAEGMQIPLSKPTHEKALHGEWSTMFISQRFALAPAGVAVAVMNVPNIPRSWAVYVNANSGVGALLQVQSGVLDVSLPVGGHIVFPGRTRTCTVTATVAAGDVTIIALGDDLLKL